MPSNYTVSEDEFGIVLQGLLEGVENKIDSGLNSCVKKACRASVKELQTTSPVGKGSEKGHYREGWTSSTRKRKSGVVGEVGNKLKPGLAHLLEKGHARVYGGGRVSGIEHIKPAARTGEQKLVDECQKLVDRALV